MQKFEFKNEFQFLKEFQYLAVSLFIVEWVLYHLYGLLYIALILNSENNFI